MISTATHPGGGKPNEDWCSATDRVAVVLDGLSTPLGVSGCTHGTPWYVSRLGERLLTHTADTMPLKNALQKSIAEVAEEHPECDLTDPGIPSSTVSIVRVGADHVEALVLADSPVVVDTGAGPDVLTDQRVNTVMHREQADALRAPTGSTEKSERMATLVRAQRAVRNTDGGYWVAGADPHAAAHAIERSWPRHVVRKFAAMSDGASSLVDLYGAATWIELLEIADREGVTSVIERVRAIEASDPKGIWWPRYKTSDDATIAFEALL